jgi:hypothetical protein
MFNSDVDVTKDNAGLYIDPQRAIQTKCMLGFYCPTNDDMIACPLGHWCAESAIAPFKCDNLSLCPYNFGYAINFTNFLLATIFISLTLLASFQLRRQQRAADGLSRNHVGNCQNYANQEDSGVETSKSMNCSSIAVEFNHLTVSMNDGTNASKIVLGNISGHIPQRKLTLMLGSTGW